MNDSRNAVFHRASNAVKRLGLDCCIERVAEGWQKQLMTIHGRGTIRAVQRLAAELQADILTRLPEADLNPDTDWLEFELCIASDDTDFDAAREN